VRRAAKRGCGVLWRERRAHRPQRSWGAATGRSASIRPDSAAERPDGVRAVVSRGGSPRPGADALHTQVIKLNRQAEAVLAGRVSTRDRARRRPPFRRAGRRWNA
jgi:hypothetical protein